MHVLCFARQTYARAVFCTSDICMCCVLHVRHMHVLCFARQTYACAVFRTLVRNDLTVAFFLRVTVVS
jgi:hypothetical protein